MPRKSITTSALACLALIAALAGMAVSGSRFASGRSVVSPLAYLRSSTNGAGTSAAARYRILTVSGSFTVPSGITRMKPFSSDWSIMPPLVPLPEKGVVFEPRTQSIELVSRMPGKQNTSGAGVPR